MVGVYSDSVTFCAAALSRLSLEEKRTSISGGIAQAVPAQRGSGIGGSCSAGRGYAGNFTPIHKDALRCRPLSVLAVRIHGPGSPAVGLQVGQGLGRGMRWGPVVSVMGALSRSSLIRATCIWYLTAPSTASHLNCGVVVANGLPVGGIGVGYASPVDMDGPAFAPGAKMTGRIHGPGPPVVGLQVGQRRIGRVRGRCCFYYCGCGDGLFCIGNLYLVPVRTAYGIPFELRGGVGGGLPVGRERGFPAYPIQSLRFLRRSRGQIGHLGPRPVHASGRFAGWSETGKGYKMGLWFP